MQAFLKFFFFYVFLEFEKSPFKDSVLWHIYVIGRKTQFWPMPDIFFFFLICFACQNSATGIDKFPRGSHIQSFKTKTLYMKVCAHSLLTATVEQVKQISSYQSITWEKMPLVNSTSIFLALYYDSLRVISVSAAFILKRFCNSYHEGGTSGSYIPHRY